jgi:NAD(P)-dependent dehydrogenase (short-subunit alcohol dehydrogenase family)
MAALFDLRGQVALITGAVGGLGRAIAEQMAASGATVVVSDLDQAQCELTAQRLRQSGHQEAYAIACDVSQRDAIDALTETALKRCQRIDILVCNAGVQGPAAGPLGESSDADWQRVLDINLRSARWLCYAVIPGMAARGAGSVILMSSIAGIRGNKSIGLYGLSKAALAQLARNLAVEWGPAGVRVNAISPGLIRTALAEPLLTNSAFMERRLALTPLRRIGEPHEIAGAVVLLASRAGAFITGHNLVIDGGTTISDGN